MRQRSIKTVEGEILKSKITNDLHMVKKIQDTRVILENYNGSVWISLLEKDLGFYYEKMSGGDT
jgi:uncharacterized protein with ACT and thioredoxin-like domain